MKAIIFNILLFITPVLASAQSSPTQQLFDQYAGKEGYTSISISKYMFDLFNKIADDEEDAEFKEITSSLTGIKILTLDEDGQKADEFYDEIGGKLSKADYKELMTVQDGKENIKFMIQEINDQIKELAMLVGGNGETVMIVIKGDIDLKQIAKLSKSIDIKGMEHLDKVEENN